jgi:predicted nucleic acid-binding protein
VTQPVRRRRWLLLDKSALVRDGDPDETLGEPCLCAITRLEMLQSARSAEDYGDMQEAMAAFHELRMNAETIEIALAAYRELGQRGTHRIPIPDLLIASCAQQNQAAVLHLDRHYDALAKVLAFEPIRLKPRQAQGPAPRRSSRPSREP